MKNTSIKKSVKKIEKKEEKYISVFPEITIVITKKVDLNYFAIKKTFKEKTAFLYTKKSTSDKNYKQYLEKIWLEYCKIWNYYFNKEDINNE